MLLACALLLAGAADRALAVTYTWTGGGGADVRWSNAANWGGDGPANGESDVGLIFPALAGPYTSDNDLGALRLTSLSVSTALGGGEYTFSGNALTIAGAAAFDSPGSGNPNLRWQIPLALAGDLVVTTSGRQTRLEGAINLGGRTLTLDTQGDLVLSGVLGGAGTLVKNGGSALTIDQANTYTGPTIGNAGALYIADAAALGATGAGTTLAGGDLGFVPNSDFTLDEPLTFSGGGIIAYGTPTIAGAVALAATAEIETFEEFTTLTIAGPVSGAGGLEKTGTGRLVLSSPAAAYGGATTVEAGTLQLEAALASTAPLTVRGGATLQGSGATAGPLVVQSGGVLAPGVLAGALAAASLTMSTGAVLSVEILGPTAGSQYDTVRSAGAIELGGATLAVTLGFDPPDGQQFVLLDNQHPAQPVAGRFADLDEAVSLPINGQTFSLTYRGGTGNDVVLVRGALPTPTITPIPPSATPVPTSSATAVPTTPGATASATRPGSATATPPATATGNGATPSRTPDAPVSPTATGTRPACTGDCDGGGTVTVNELILGVNVALGNSALSGCRAFDADSDGEIVIAELIEAVRGLLNGCP